MKQSSNIVIFLYFSRFVIVTIWTNHIEFIRRMTYRKFYSISRK